MTDYSTFLDMTAEEIAEDWLDFMEARDPRLRDKSVYSFNRMFAEGVAVQFWLFIQLLKQKIEESGIMTATGTALDAVVADRLPAGRQTGTFAEGIIKFSRDSVATYDVPIPAGTRVAAVGEDSEMLYFVTTEDTTIDTGERYGYAAAKAEQIGIAYNVGTGDITILATARVGVHGATNDAPFSGGTDRENDAALRDRAIYTIWAPGRATVPVLVERLTAISGVTEAVVATIGQGDVLLVIDASVDIADDIEDCLIENMGAGSTAPGVLGAELRTTGHQFEIEDCSGAEVWIRPRSFIPTEQSISFSYVDQGGSARSGSVTIPASNPRGVAIQATLTEGLATKITASPYAGDYEFDVYMARGTYPYGWVQPELQGADATLEIVMTATPETGLLANIQASLEAFLNDYRIGTQLEFADIVDWAKFDYVEYAAYGTYRRFQGIDDIPVFSVVCKTETIDAFGESVEIDDDERVMAGTVSVTEYEE